MKKLILLIALLAAPSFASAQDQECETYETEGGGFTVQTCTVSAVWSGPAMCRRDGGEIVCPDPAAFDRPAQLECVLDAGQVFCWDRGFNTPLQVRTCESINGEMMCNRTDAAEFLRLRDR